jgi:hypothetical protein
MCFVHKVLHAADAFFDSSSVVGFVIDSSS